MSNVEDRELARRFAEGVETERRRIARDLHDGPSQELSLVILELESFESTLDSSAGARLVLRQVIERMRRLLTKLRQLGQDLHPHRLEVLGLESALRLLGRDLGHRLGLEVETEIGSGIDRLVPTEASIEIYRIAQEALANAGRHARVSEVRMVLRQEGDRILLTVKDEGVGFRRSEARAREGLGLVGIEERATAVGGEARILTRLGQGTEVRASFPLEAW